MVCIPPVSFEKVRNRIRSKERSGFLWSFQWSEKSTKIFTELRPQKILRRKLKFRATALFSNSSHSCVLEDCSVSRSHPLSLSFFLPLSQNRIAMHVAAWNLIDARQPCVCVCVCVYQSAIRFLNRYRYRTTNRGPRLNGEEERIFFTLRLKIFISVNPLFPFLAKDKAPRIVVR